MPFVYIRRKCYLMTRNWRPLAGGPAAEYPEWPVLAPQSGGCMIDPLRGGYGMGARGGRSSEEDDKWRRWKAVHYWVDMPL